MPKPTPSLRTEGLPLNAGSADPGPKSVPAGQPPLLPRALVLLVGAAAVFLSILGLRNASGIVGPAFLALVIVIAISPLTGWLRRHGAPNWLAMVVTMLCAYVVVIGFALSVVLSIAKLATLLPDYQAQFSHLLDQATGWLHRAGVTQKQINTAVNSFDLGTLVGTLQQVLSGLTSVLSDLVFVLTLLFFLVMDANSFPQRLASAGQRRGEVVAALASFAHTLRTYVVVSSIFGLICAVLDVAALYWIAVPLPLLWGVLSFLTNYIPNIGFVVGLIPPTLLALLEGGLRSAVLVVVAYCVINVVIQSFIQPTFLGDAVGLSVTLTFLSVVFWAYVLGPLGALLAVPLTLFVKAILVDSDPSTRWLQPLLTTGGKAPDGAPTS